MNSTGSVSIFWYDGEGNGSNVLGYIGSSCHYKGAHPLVVHDKAADFGACVMPKLPFSKYIQEVFRT
jgi:hypothetical protein